MFSVFGVIAAVWATLSPGPSPTRGGEPEVEPACAAMGGGVWFPLSGEVGTRGRGLAAGQLPNSHLGHAISTMGLVSICCNGYGTVASLV